MEYKKYSFAVLFALLAVGTTGKNKRFFCKPDDLWLVEELFTRNEVKLVKFWPNKIFLRGKKVDSKLQGLPALRELLRRFGTESVLKFQVETSKDVIEKWHSYLKSQMGEVPLELRQKLVFKDGELLRTTGYGFVSHFKTENVWDLFQTPCVSIDSIGFTKNYGYAPWEEIFFQGYTLLVFLKNNNQVTRTKDWFGGLSAVSYFEAERTKLEVGGTLVLKWIYDWLNAYRDMYPDLIRDYSPIIYFFQIIKNKSLYNYFETLNPLTGSQRPPLTESEIQNLLDGKPFRDHPTVEVAFYKIFEILQKEGFNPEYTVPIHVYFLMGQKGIKYVLLILNLFTKPCKLLLQDGQPVLRVRAKMNAKKIAKLTGLSVEDVAYVFNQSNYLITPKNSSCFLTDLKLFLDKYHSKKKYREMTKTKKPPANVSKAIERIKFDFFPPEKTQTLNLAS